MNLQTPEIKFFDTHFPTNRNLETNVKGIFVVGDGTGKSRGIVGEGIYGIIAAQGIAEKDYHDQQLSIILNKPLAEIKKMKTAEKREILMKYRKEELKKLISVYYAERGWSSAGIPKVDTLKQIGLWNFLNEETKTRITKMNGQ